MIKIITTLAEVSTAIFGLFFLIGISALFASVTFQVPYVSVFNEMPFCLLEVIMVIVYFIISIIFFINKYDKAEAASGKGEGDE